ncbi:hypothetical protein [Mycoplasma sp. 3686d]|uniref:hypothetical protein n=1 Tax=Mycoplasma sp. 3686d TaxID=2967300 RepID=UPI00211CC5F2|nr:hypothetical protein [Mycoplasma sp. 3686d]UUM24550.1 hypothetical protein NPA12_02510 [Mycoplasma sp. 3686d]
MTNLERKHKEIAQKNYQHLDSIFKTFLEQNNESTKKDLSKIKQLLDKLINDKEYRIFNLSFNLAFNLPFDLSPLKPSIKNIKEINLILSGDLDNSQFANEFFASYTNNYKKVVDFKKQLDKELKEYGFSLYTSDLILGHQITRAFENGIKYVQLNDDRTMIEKELISNDYELLEKILEHAIKIQIKDLTISEKCSNSDKQATHSTLSKAQFIDNVNLTQLKQTDKQAQEYKNYFHDIVNDVWKTGLSYKALKIIEIDSSLETIKQLHELFNTEYEDLLNLETVNHYLSTREYTTKSGEEWEDIIQKDIKKGISKKFNWQTFIKLAHQVFNEVQSNEFYEYCEYENQPLRKIPRADLIDGIINYIYENKLKALKKNEEKR